MSKTPRIRTPWKQQWRRVRYQALPLLVFLGAGAGALWLWNRHVGFPNAVGEVGAVRLDAVSPSDGHLVPLPGRTLALFDKVKAGDVIARLDPGPAQASLETLEEELAQLTKQLDATQAQILQEQAARTHDELVERRRLLETIERLRLDILDRKTLIKADEEQLVLLNERLEAVQALYDSGVEARLTLVNIKADRDVIQKRLEGNRDALAEAEGQKTECEQRLRDYTLTQAAELAKLLAPLEAAIATQKKRIQEVQLQIDTLLIKAPIDGVITGIHKWAGQNVLAGDPVMTVASRDSQYILSYVRQETRIKPVIGMTVEVSVRTLPRLTAAARVEEVGPQVEPVPLHQLRDPKVPEWGLPVRISVPDVLGLKPGELVDVTFRPEWPLGAGVPLLGRAADAGRVELAGETSRPGPAGLAE